MSSKIYGKNTWPAHKENFFFTFVTFDVHTIIFDIDMTLQFIQFISKEKGEEFTTIFSELSTGHRLVGHLVRNKKNCTLNFFPLLMCQLFCRNTWQCCLWFLLSNSSHLIQGTRHHRSYGSNNLSHHPHPPPHHRRLESHLRPGI